MIILRLARLRCSLISICVVMAAISLPRIVQCEGALSVKFVLESNGVPLGTPVLVDIYVVNNSDSTQQIDLGGNGYLNVSMSVVRPDGVVEQRPPYERRNQLTFPGVIPLDPHQTYIKTYVMDGWFDFSKPGKYVINLGLESDKGITFSGMVDITPKDPQAASLICKSLLARIEDTRSAEKSSAALQALRYVKYPESVTFWRRVIEYPGMRDIAIQQLYLIGTEDAAKILISKMNLPDAATQVFIRRALEGILRDSSDENAKSVVRSALKNKNEQ